MMNEYNNLKISNMKKQDQSFENCLKLAAEFLTEKERKNYYLFTAYDDFSDTDYGCFNVLSDSDVAQLRELKDKYGRAFFGHLGEVFDDPDTIHDFTGGGDILDIDLDTVYHRYGIVLHELHPDGAVFSTRTKVTLSDDQYARLIAWHLYDEHLTMNLLRHHDRELYDVVMLAADNYYSDTDCDCLMVSHPYLVTLDEAKADSEQIVVKHNIKRNGWYRGVVPRL